MSEIISVESEIPEENTQVPENGSVETKIVEENSENSETSQTLTDDNLVSISSNTENDEKINQSEGSNDFPEVLKGSDTFTVVEKKEPETEEVKTPTSPFEREASPIDPSLREEKGVTEVPNTENSPSLSQNPNCSRKRLHENQGEGNVDVKRLKVSA